MYLFLIYNLHILSKLNLVILNTFIITSILFELLLATNLILATRLLLLKKFFNLKILKLLYIFTKL